MQVKGHDEANAPGTVNVVPSEGGYYEMPISQLQKQAELLHRMIEDRIQRGGLNNFETGTFNQPMSAVALVQISQGQDLIVMPRLGTRGLLKQDIVEMGIKQIIEAEAGDSFKMGSKDWEVAKLKGEYAIEFIYSFKDAKLEMARTSMAASQRGLIPDKSIRRDTLQREDPDGDERELRWEEAERLSPLIKMDRTIRSLLKEADRGEEGAEEEAMMLTAQLIPALKQAMAGEMTPEPEEQAKPSQPLLPTM